MDLRPAAADLPQGTVTFLFTDIEGSEARRVRDEPRATSLDEALAAAREVVEILREQNRPTG